MSSGRIVFLFEDGETKEFQVLGRIHGMKINGKRPIGFKISGDDFLRGKSAEEFGKWINRAVLPVLRIGDL